MTTVKEIFSQRLIEVREALGLNLAELARGLEVPRTTLVGWEEGKTVPIGLLSGLERRYRVSPDWFLSGAGPMFRGSKLDTVSNLQDQESSLEVSELQSEMLPVKNHDHRGVPYYDVEASAHIAEVLDGAQIEPEFYVDFQPFNDCSAYLTVYGDSMYPAIQSGEVIAVKEVTNLDVLLWGEKYLVVTDGESNSLRTVKLVHQHEDSSKIILRASNPNFKGDTVIPKTSILKMFIVKGKISRGHL